MSNVYALSDEELLNTDLESFNEEAEPNEEDSEEPQEKPEEDQETEELEADTESETESETDEQPDQEEGSEDTPEEETPDTTEESDVDTTNQEDNSSDEETTPNEVEKQESKESKTDVPDPKELMTFYEELTSSFKAAGKEVKVTNAADIKALMQQGISYSQKMAAMKPGMNILRTLESHNLNDPEKISYLIDLHNKKPEAIAKLIKDSEIDLYDFDADEKSSGYVPDTKVREQTKLEEVVNELVDSDGFTEVFNAISIEWDVPSRQAIIDNPALLKIIQSQKESGDYDRIVETIAQERMFGRLQDVNYIDAYVEVERSLAKPVVETKPKESFKAARPKPKQANNNGKKAKATSPNSGTSNTKESFDPLKVSDEELMRMVNQQTKF